MRKQHINPTQRIKANEFRPIMRDEIPYYETLNRAARSAYNYADTINAYLSYGGFASVVQPGIDPAVHTFKLYEIVKVTDDELILPLDLTDPDNIRVGIVVAEANVDPNTNVHSDIVVCMFCQNFVYPDRSVDMLWGEAPTTLYLSDDPSTLYLSPEPKAGLPDGSIGKSAIAVKVGSRSIAFNGTRHADAVMNAENANNATNLTIANNLTSETAYPTWVLNTSGYNPQYVTSSNFRFIPSSGNLSATYFTGNGKYLTNLQANTLEGTIPQAVLTNSSFYIGTTNINLTRPSGEQALTGITSLNGSTVSIGSDSNTQTVNIATGTLVTDVSLGTGQAVANLFLGSGFRATNIKIGSVGGNITLGAHPTVASNIIIGGVNDTVTINGVVTYQQTQNLEVKDKLIRLNDGGAAGSTAGAGIEVEEDGSGNITAFIKTNDTRDSWEFKTPARQGHFFLKTSPVASYSTLECTATSNRTYTFPDKSGTIALTTDTIDSASSVTVSIDNTSGNVVYPVWSAGTSGNAELKVSNSQLFFKPNTGNLYSIGDAVFNNVTVGAGAGNNSTNTVVGSLAFPVNTTGHDNVLVGFRAGETLVSGSGNTILGANAENLAADANNNIILASGGVTRAKFNGTNWTLTGTTTATISGTSTGISGGTSGCLWYNTATNTTTKLDIGSAGKLLRSTGTAPTWSTLTIPDTISANNILFASSANTLAGLSTANNGVLITDTTGVPSVLAGTTGVLVGSTTQAPQFTATPTLTSLSLPQATQVTGTLTTSNTGINQQLDAFSSTSFRSAKYLMSITSGVHHHVVELTVLHDGTTVYMNQYGTIVTGGLLATFDAVVSEGQVLLRTTPANAVTKYSFLRFTVAI